MSPELRAERAAAEALETLGVRCLAFGVHASAFPPGAADVGYGSPHATGEALLRFLRPLGFNALQLGPGGQVTDLNPSPYDGTVFARGLRSLDLDALARGPEALLEPAELSALLAAEPPAAEQARGGRSDPARARRAVARALDLAYARLARLRAQQPEHPLLAELARFRLRARPWLALDAPFEALAARLGHDDPARFDPAVLALFEGGAAGEARRAALAVTLAEPIERAELGQLLAFLQAERLRAQARAQGFTLLGDLQIGWSARDRLLRPELFCQRFLLGAPPSRTNPEGQPWGYPLLDPDQLDDAQSPARRLFALQLEELFSVHDGIRIDHPHGLVCPWIYPADAADPQRAVREGTRAFESPDLPDTDLQRWAIARAADLDPDAPSRFDDGWVREHDPAQVSRYARLIEEVLETARARGLGVRRVAVEVLSTCPRPLREVLARHGLGRFRVTQKADPENPHDVYRTDRAEPADWVMLGNHDTAPIFDVIERWHRDGSLQARAAYLAARLVPDAAARARAAAEYCSSPFALAQAHLADLFVSDAEQVSIYFTDLFGEREPFNRAGVVHPDNWSLRLPADFAQAHAARVREQRALDPLAALAQALRARRLRPDLAAALESH